MKHYFNPFSRAVTTHWMLTELNVDHEQVVVDLTAGGSRTPEYLAINPMGKVPALVDGDTVVTEVAAICAYLADRYPAKGFAPPTDSPERGRYYRYLFFPGTTLEPMFAARLFGLTDYPAESAGWGDYERCMNTVASMIPESDWVLESGFSAADVVFGGALDLAVNLGWIEAPGADLAAYVARIRERPAYRKSHDPS